MDFSFLLKQNELSKQYAEQQKETKKQKAIDKKAKNYYGDSKEYKQEWEKQNKRKSEPKQRTKWI